MLTHDHTDPAASIVVDDLPKWLDDDCTWGSMIPVALDMGKEFPAQDKFYLNGWDDEGSLQAELASV